MSELESFHEHEQADRRTSYPTIYPICLILSKLRPFVFKSNQSAKIAPKSDPDSSTAEEYSTLSHKSSRAHSISLSTEDYKFFSQYLVTALQNRNYLVRNLVSKSLICVLPDKEISGLFSLLITPISSTHTRPFNQRQKDNQHQRSPRASLCVLLHPQKLLQSTQAAPGEVHFHGRLQIKCW